VSNVLRSYDELFLLWPKGKEDVCQLELDLKNFQELRLNLFKKVLHFIRILDQGMNQSREQILHTSKLARDTSRLWLLTIYVEQG
jgi:hypothetical protein